LKQQFTSQVWLSGTHNSPVGVQVQGDVHDIVYKYITCAHTQI